MGGRSDATGRHWWIAAVALTVYLVTALLATAQSTTTDQFALRVGASFAVTSAGCWWLAMLLLSSARAHPRWALVFIEAAVALSIAALAIRTRSARQWWVAGLSAGAASCLSIFVIAVSTYAVLPRLVPKVAVFPYGGLTPAALAATNQIEAIDPYITELVLGALLSLVSIICIVATRTSGAWSSAATSRLACEPLLEFDPDSDWEILR